jgi:hypothetical protein
MNAPLSVRAEFTLASAIPTITGFTPEQLQTYISTTTQVDTPAEFIWALPPEFKQNWILMTRSESLQTGTARSPRILLPSADARYVFTVGMTPHTSYPGSHPNAIEYMQWDAVQKNFRFHEIVLAPIGPMGSVPARGRMVSIDDSKCHKCHSTRNVLNRSGASHGTTGILPLVLPAKNKPNWDTYDSWGGMLSFNRDRIFQGSVEAAAFRTLLNPWTWSTNEPVRSIIEQLVLQPPLSPTNHAITRTNGGPNDGHVNFAFDGSPPVLMEPRPSGPDEEETNYAFDGVVGAGTPTTITQGGLFITLHHSIDPTNDEGRGVELFDRLTAFNAQRIASELISHTFATGSIPIEIRPVTLAILKSCVNRDVGANTVRSTTATPLADLGFFNARHGTGIGINQLHSDTASRAQLLPRRKADIQKLNLVRADDPYVFYGPMADPAPGLMELYGATTTAGTATSVEWIRREVFRRPLVIPGVESFRGDRTMEMMGIYVDRENYDVGSFNTELVTLFRYFLEPLGVSVDKWSMGVRGRSRTYTFADVFPIYVSVLQNELEASLRPGPGSRPIEGLVAPFDCDPLIVEVNRMIRSLPLPPAMAPMPKYTDIQRILNKSCVECHGGLNYPPVSNFGVPLDLSEDESVTMGVSRLRRSHSALVDGGYVTPDPMTSRLYTRIIASGTTETCAATSYATYPLMRQRMPCGGPMLSQADIETIRMWILGPPAHEYSEGDPHLKTVDGTAYDFQAAGEFVLLRGENVEIQTRQSAVETTGPLGPNPHTGLTSCVSVNTAVAVQAGAHRITYQPNLSGKPDPNGLELRIDGKLTNLDGKEFLLPAGGRIIPTAASGGIQIEYPGGTVVAITPYFWDYYQVWLLNINTHHTRATEGIMGAIAPGNWLPTLPDGTLIGPMPDDLHQRYVDLYGKFADAWRVSDETSLFDYAPGTSTATFTLKSWPGEATQVCTLQEAPGSMLSLAGVAQVIKPPLEPLPREEAEVHCNAIVDEERRGNCVQDVMVTGEPGFAQLYLRTEQVVRNALPAAPSLLSPQDYETMPAQKDTPLKVSFRWDSASDPDGDPLAYRHCVWDVDEGFTLNNCSALLGQTLMREAELEPDQVYFWKVIVEDGKGGTTESETRLFTTHSTRFIDLFVPFITR